MMTEGTGYREFLDMSLKAKTAEMVISQPDSCPVPVPSDHISMVENQDAG